MKFGSRDPIRGRYREIQPENMPQKAVVHYADFSKGYDSSDATTDVPENVSPFMQDIEVTVHDSLVRCPGVTHDEEFGRESMLPQMILHASLDNRSELLFLDPPYIGVKTTGETVWYDVGLVKGNQYTYTNFGGSLIFGNGIQTAYVRQPDATTVEELPSAPVARTYATFAGRVWAGGATIDGRYEPLGLVWSSAFSNYEDWTGVGSGFELLISNVMSGDRVVALRPMGLDFMAIVCRRSIWIGRRTGLRDRPADFQPRVPGIGAINEASVCVTRFGVIFLSDTGVYLFDGNNVELISKNINKDLLPLNMDNIDKYSASYNPFSKRFYLHTPRETWVYDLDYNRWYRRSLIARASQVFTEQFDHITWGELIGTWGEQKSIWADYSKEEGHNYKHFFLSDMLLGVEDKHADYNFNDPLEPIWETATGQSNLPTELTFIDDIMLHYREQGLLEVSLMDNEGHFQQVVDLFLPMADKEVVSRKRLIHAGRGVGMRVKWLDGNVELLRMSLGFRVLSARIENMSRFRGLPAMDGEILQLNGENIKINITPWTYPTPFRIIINGITHIVTALPWQWEGKAYTIQLLSGDGGIVVPTVPSAPTGLVAAVLSHTRIATTVDVQADVSFRWYRDSVMVGATAGATFTHLDLEPDTEYLFSASAVNHVGESALCTPIVARTEEEPVIPIPEPPPPDEPPPPGPDPEIPSPDPADEEVILTAYRVRGGGDILVGEGSCVPLLPGAVTPDTLDEVALFDAAGIEQRIAVRGVGRHADGSYRTLSIQVMAKLFAGQTKQYLMVWGTPRTTVDLDYVMPDPYNADGTPKDPAWFTEPGAFGVPAAYMLPTDPSYLIRSLFIPGGTGLLPLSETAAVPDVGERLAMSDQRFDYWQRDRHLYGIGKTANNVIPVVTTTNPLYSNPDSGADDTFVDQAGGPTPPPFKNFRMVQHPSSSHTHMSSYEAGRSFFEMYARTGNTKYWEEACWITGTLAYHQRWGGGANSTNNRVLRNTGSTGYVNYAPGQIAPYFLTTADPLALENMLHVAYGGGYNSPRAQISAWGDNTYPQPRPPVWHKYTGYHGGSIVEPRPYGRALLAQHVSWAMTRPEAENDPISGEKRFATNAADAYLHPYDNEARLKTYVEWVLDTTSRRLEDGQFVNRSSCNPSISKEEFDAGRGPVTIQEAPACNTFMQTIMLDALIRIMEDGPEWLRKAEIPALIFKNLDGLRKYWNAGVRSKVEPSFRNWFSNQDCVDYTKWSETVDLNSMYPFMYAWAGTKHNRPADMEFAKIVMLSAVGTGGVTSRLDGSRGPYLTGIKQSHEHWAYQMQSYGWLADG
jgi:hypothetical protein